MNLGKFKFLKLRVENAIDVGIMKKKLLMESKIQNYVKDVQALLTLKII